MTLRKKIFFTKNGVHILKSHLKKKDKIQKMGDLMSNNAISVYKTILLIIFFLLNEYYNRWPLTTIIVIEEVFFF